MVEGTPTGVATSTEAAVRATDSPFQRVTLRE
jgi:hypothetical protein